MFGVVTLLGVEVRANGFVVIQDSVVTNSGSQGLVAHAGALGYIARRLPVSWFSSNARIYGYLINLNLFGMHCLASEPYCLFVLVKLCSNLWRVGAYFPVTVSDCRSSAVCLLPLVFVALKIVRLLVSPVVVEVSVSCLSFFRSLKYSWFHSTVTETVIIIIINLRMCSLS